jgi:integrase/recombinase XerD
MNKIIDFDSSRNITLDEGLTLCIREKKIMGIRPKTLAGYELKFTHFMNFMGKDTKCITIKRADVLNFVEWKIENNKDIRPNTIASYLSAIRTVLYFLMQDGHVKPFKITVKVSKNKLKKNYDEKEIETLLIKPSKKEGWITFRNWLICCIFMGTGMRLRSISHIKNEDVDLKNGFIYVDEIKNDMPMSIPITNDLVGAISEYMTYRKGEATDYLLCDMQGKRLTESGIQSAIKRYNNKRGIKRAGVHSFRHTFAMDFLLSGGDISTLKTMLGHQSYEMVNEYANLCGMKIKALADKHNPLGKYRNSMKTNKRIKF